MREKGRTAVVTGAGKGIGLAISRRFMEDGYNVCMLDLNENLVKKAASDLTHIDTGKAIGLKCDVSSISEITCAMETAAKEYGGIDVLVNNAGILFSTPIPEVSEEEWDIVMAVNLKGMFFAVQKALPYLTSGCSPRVVNISSLAGRMGGFETGMAYSASKGGAIALTMGLARQLAKFGITVNVVCPSTTESDIIKQWSAQQIDGLRARIPLGRLGKPEEIASAVAYLASKEAGYITGLVMDVNGGIYMA